MKDTYIVDTNANGVYLYWGNTEITLYCIADCFKFDKVLQDNDIRCKISFAFAKNANFVKLLNKKKYIELWKTNNPELLRYCDPDKTTELANELFKGE